jgi:WD40 repeat protein
VHAVAFSPDGQRIVSGSADGSLRLWNLRGDPVSEPIEGHQGSVWAVTMHPDGQTCYSGGEDGTVRVWTVGWRAWLALAAERLRHHPAIVESDSEVAAAVRAILDGQPWSRPVAVDGA